jgi:hypothetical protein
VALHNAGIGDPAQTVASNEHADTRPDPLDQLDEPSRELPVQRYQGLPTDTRWTGFEERASRCITAGRAGSR